MNDEELLRGFAAGTLRAFPHEDHVRVVHLLALRYGPDAALDQVSAGIRAMAIANGKPDAFHVTRTVAWTRIVARLTAGAEAGDSLDFLSQHPELARRDLLDDYYSAGRLTTDHARTTFVEPDLKAL